MGGWFDSLIEDAWGEWGLSEAWESTGLNIGDWTYVEPEDSSSVSATGVTASNNSSSGETEDSSIEDTLGHTVTSVADKKEYVSASTTNNSSKKAANGGIEAGGEGFNFTQKLGS